MEEGKLAVLQADIEGQMALIEEVHATLEERAADLQPGNEMQLESVAYQLHNLYNAIEDLFKIVADHFENQIAETPRWHTELLRRMREEIPGVRPALISRESYTLLNGLRGFRHFFRHAYGVPIEYAQLQINLEKARRLRPLLQQDVTRFLQQLRGASE